MRKHLYKTAQSLDLLKPNLPGHGIIRIPSKNTQNYFNTPPLPDLPSLNGIKELFKGRLISSLVAVSKSTSSNTLSEAYINSICNRAKEIHLTFIPEDLKNLFTSLESIKYRQKDLVQLLCSDLRRLHLNLTIDQIVSIFKSFAQIHSRSIRTIKLLLHSLNRDEDFKLWHIRELISAFSKLRLGKIFDDIEKLVRLIERRIPSLISEMTPFEMAIISNSLINLPKYSPETIKFIASRMNFILEKATLRDLSLMSNAYARAQIPTDHFIKNLVNRSVQLVDMHVLRIFNQKSICVNGLDLSILLNSLLRLDYLTEELANKTIPIIMYISHTLTPQSLANIVHSYGKTNVIERSLSHRLAEIAAKRAKKFNAQELGMLARGLTLLKLDMKVFWDRLADEVLYRGTIGFKFNEYKFDLESLESLAFAFGRRKPHDPHVFYVINQLLKRELSKSQDLMLKCDTLSSIIYSFSAAKMKYVECAFPLITHQLAKMVNTVSNNSIVKIMRACNNLSTRQPKLMNILVRECDKRVDILEVTGLIKCLESLSQLGHYNLELIKKSLKRIAIFLNQLTIPNLIDLLVSLREFQYRNVTLLKRICMRLQMYFADITVHQACIIFSCLSYLRCSDIKLYNSLCRKILSGQFELSQPLVSQVSLSALFLRVHLDYYARELATVGKMLEGEFELFDQIQTSMLNILSGQQTSINIYTLRTLQTLGLYYKHIYKSGYSRLPDYAKDMLEKAVKARISLDEYIPKPSASHREFSTYLFAAGINHVNEFKLGPYSLDMFVISSNTVIEYDGPSHFYRETTMRNPKSLLKHDILIAMGYNLIHVPFFEWDQLSNRIKNIDSRKKKIFYCIALDIPKAIIIEDNKNEESNDKLMKI